MGSQVKFQGCNSVFTAPEGREDVSDLHLFRNRVANVFAIELDAQEKLEFERTGRIFVSVLSGSQFYPIYVGTESTVRELVADYGPVWRRDGIETKTGDGGSST